MTNANTTYEEDCTTSLQPGVAAPFAVVANINTTTDSAAPTGASFGISGAATVGLAGPFLAEFADNSVLTSAGVGLTVSGLTFGSTDGTATGSYSLTTTIPQSASYYSTSALTGVSFASGVTTIAYTGGTVAVGDGISGTGIGSAEVVNVVANTSITLSSATTAASGGAYASYTGADLTTSPFTSPATAFTTNGVNGGKASVGITGLSGMGVNIALTVQFGATSAGNGVGAANCLETGWDASNNPAFPQTNETTPGFPPASLGGPGTPLVLATGGFITQPGVTAGDGITPPAAAYVNLVSGPPTANSQTVNLGEGGTGSVTLTANAGSSPVATYSLVGGSPQTLGGRLTVTQVGSTAVVNLSDSGATATVLTFQFNACDGESPPVCTATPGTITVDIGSPPVIQPFTEQVNPGQLVLSCDSPSNYIAPAGQNQSPAPTSSNPLLQCPEFQFPSITLDGLEQTVTGTTGETGGNPSGSAPGTIYISDNRGQPTDSWTLTGTFVPTPTGTIVSGGNPNASCAGVDAFCNSSIGAAALNTATNGAHDGQIAPNYLEVGGITCAADSSGGTNGYNPPNLNPNATPTAGGNFGSPVTLCSAAVGQSGGTFLYNATYALTIPESVYAGNYVGSVQYTVG